MMKRGVVTDVRNLTSVMLLDTLTSSEGIKCSVDSRVQSLNLVSESGLYDLIMQSRKPEAKAFKRWVTHEVLPSIRKTGSYSVQAQPAMLPNFCNPAESPSLISTNYHTFQEPNMA